MASAAVSSAGGLLAMLNEDERVLKAYALQNLDLCVAEFWAEIADHISDIESLYEDESFSHRKLAALLASKVFYYLGELNESLTYALGAEDLFSSRFSTNDAEYVNTLIAACIDRYIAQRREQEVSGIDSVTIDERLVAIVEKKLDSCVQDGQLQQAVGIALECRRLDKLEAAIKGGNLIQAASVMVYTLTVAQNLVHRKSFRHSVYRLVVRLYEELHCPDYGNICQCLMFLDDPASVAKILEKLLRGTEDQMLMGYQVAFDLYANDLQKFLSTVRDLLPDPLLATAASTAPAEPDSSSPTPMDVDESPVVVDPEPPIEAEKAADISAVAGPSEPAANEDAALVAPAANPQAPPEVVQYADRLAKLKRILSGEMPTELTLRFLYHFAKSDLTILRNMKTEQDTRSRVLHTAVVNANAFMFAGTTVDKFLRDNLEWLRRATNWSKFSATASLGVIHRGHVQNARTLMAPYLSTPGGMDSSPFPEGGALYALGLIHVNHGESIKQYLLERLRLTGSEVVQHGACLALGLATLGTADPEVYEELKSILHTDSAVAGEAAGLAMGLLMVGTNGGEGKAAEMLAYAHDTQHEKIIRGLSMGVALMVYACEEEADPLIQQMTLDQDPILRYGAMFAIGLAYRGTGNSEAIRKLLHFAVSDVSDDVRRAAVMCIGFVLYSQPHQVPKTVALLAESYNPHVRYGAAMAVGIACAGFPLKEALDVVEPLLKDPVDFVRQGALMAMAMMLMQCTEEREPRAGAFRRHLDKVLADKHEEAMCKMGATLAYGIIDAGGRNVTISLRSRTVFDRMTAVVSMAVFAQYWYWYPLVFFLSLTFSATAFIGLNKNVRVPNFYFLSAAKESLFGYPPSVSVKVPSFSRMPAARLSAVKARAAEKQRKREEKEKAEKERERAAIERLDKKKAEKEKLARNMIAVAEGREVAEKEGDSMDIDGAKDKESPAVPEAERAVYVRLRNPSRVVPAQEAYIKFISKCRYVAIQRRSSGFVMLKDRRPAEPEQLADSEPTKEAGVEAAPPAPTQAAQETAEAILAPAEPEEEKKKDGDQAPPEPFEFS